MKIVYLWLTAGIASRRLDTDWKKERDPLAVNSLDTSTDKNSQNDFHKVLFNRINYYLKTLFTC